MKQQGLTLLELLTVVTLLGIIAAIVYPTYENHVENGRRADAKAALTAVAQRLERCHTVQASYQDCIPDESFNANNRLSTEQAFYEVSVATPSANTYLLTAVRIHAESRNTCGNLTLNQLGVRGVIESDKPAADCW